MEALTAPPFIDDHDEPFDTMQEWAAHQLRRIDAYAPVAAASVLSQLEVEGLRRKPGDLERVARAIESAMSCQVHRIVENRAVADGDVNVH